MKKIIFILFLIVPLISFSEELTPIQKKLIQNRVVQTNNFEGLSYAICEALMDLNISKNCSLNVIAFMQENNDESMIKKIKESGMAYQASYSDKDMIKDVSIKMFKVKNDYYRINISIKNQQDNTKEIFNSEDYNKIFSAIETSIFINRLEAKLGVEND